MSFPKPVPETKLEAMRKAEEDRIKRWEEVNYDPAAHVGASVDKRHRQERFLGIFAQCLSPALACKQSGTAMSTYKKWRKDDLWFCEQLNDVMEDWRDELLSSAITRAIGRTHENEDGEILTDAHGKVIYTEASDSLARSLLQMDQPEKGSGAAVNITLNIDRFTGVESTEDILSIEEANYEEVER